MNDNAPRHPDHPGWPETTHAVQLLDGAWVRLRPLNRHDGQLWQELRIADQEFLEPVEPTVEGTWEFAHSASAWRNTFGFLYNSARSGTAVPFAIELDQQFVGQLTLGNIQHGIVSECWIGYWVASEVTGRGIAKSAVALGVDHAFARIGLHRVTATHLAENPASGAVLVANGFQEEGVLRRNLHINGSWQDHLLLALIRDDFASSAVDRLRADGKIR